MTGRDEMKTVPQQHRDNSGVRVPSWPPGAAAVLATALAIALAATPTYAQIPRLHRSDSHGFTWDVGEDGMIRGGSNDAFDGACRMYVNGNSFNPRSGNLEAGGDGLELHGQVGSIEVRRSIRVDTSGASIRYIETFANTSRRAQQVKVRVQTNLGSNCRGFYSDRGRPNITKPEEDESGVLAWQGPGSRPSILTLFRHGSDGRMPQVQLRSNRHVQLDITLKLEPGKEASLLHGLAQRQVKAIPDEKTVQKLFEPLLSHRWIKDVPAEVRGRIVNLGEPGWFSWPGATFQERLAALAVQRGSDDVLAVGLNTRLRGSASGGPVTVETEYGSAAVPLEKIALLAGEGSRRGSEVWLRDGQILRGSLRLGDLNFSTAVGPPIRISAGSLDRLVLHSAEEDGTPPQGTLCYLATSTGQRLGVTEKSPSPLAVITPWGRLEVPLERVQRLQRLDRRLPGYVLKLTEGTMLFCYLEQRPLGVETLSFGRQSFAPGQIAAITSASAETSREGQEGPSPDAPRVTLTGRNLLPGRLSGARLHFRSGGAILPVPGTQVRTMQRVEEPPRRAGGFGGPLFEVELWDGGTITGRLQEQVLTVQTGRETFQIPARDIMEVRAPMPRVPEGMQQRIASLIRRLGHESWQAREEATRELREIGMLALPQLKEVQQETSDPEIRRRAERLIEELEQ